MSGHTKGTWRAIAHRWFDALWKDGIWTRDEAKDWLQGEYGVRHISMLTVQQCREVAERARLIAETTLHNPDSK